MVTCGITWNLMGISVILNLDLENVDLAISQYAITHFYMVQIHPYTYFTFNQNMLMFFRFCYMIAQFTSVEIIEWAAM